MGTISILLGLITFFGFILAGVYSSILIVDYKAMLSMALTSLSSIPNWKIYLAVIALFAFVGLLIGMNLLMNGLNYNKLSKLQRQYRHRG